MAIPAEKETASVFDLKGKTAVVTGGGGVLGGVIAAGLAKAGANVAISDLFLEKAVEQVKAIEDLGFAARAYKMDAFDMGSICACNDAVCSDLGHIDILINAVGGNMKQATTAPDLSFFDLPADAIRKVFDLNVISGTIVPCQIFGKRMKDNPDGGSIINISSMNAFRPLTRIPGYSAAKAAVSNFTQWLAVHLAQEYSPNLRVNAIAPGFFLTDQNRFLLTDEQTGALTPRGQTIMAHTPAGRFGDPEDLVGTTVWLASDASRFVTGIVVPVDGGFSAFSGV
jgi:NAD(P)-dependent dehydrogenase (short-subunit alcohol dehydrogenase family)